MFNDAMSINDNDNGLRYKNGTNEMGQLAKLCYISHAVF